MAIIKPRKLVGNVARHVVMGRPVTPRYIVRSIVGTWKARAFLALLRAVLRSVRS